MRREGEGEDAKQRKKNTKSNILLSLRFTPLISFA